MVIVCIDYGERHVGLAKTDPDGMLALREGTIDQQKEDALVVIRELVEAERAERVLVGVPLGLDGEETKQTHVTLAFMDRLRDELGEVEVIGVDEVFTSKEARRLLQAEGLGMEQEHAEAARLMLEHYIKSSK